MVRERDEDRHVWEKNVEELEDSLRDIMCIEGDYPEVPLTPDDVALVSAVIDNAKDTLDAIHDSLLEIRERILKNDYGGD